MFKNKPKINQIRTNKRLPPGVPLGHAKSPNPFGLRDLLGGNYLLFIMMNDTIATAIINIICFAIRQFGD